MYPLFIWDLQKVPDKPIQKPIVLCWCVGCVLFMMIMIHDDVGGLMPGEDLLTATGKPVATPAEGQPAARAGTVVVVGGGLGGVVPPIKTKPNGSPLEG